MVSSNIFYSNLFTLGKIQLSKVTYYFQIQLQN